MSASDLVAQLAVAGTPPELLAAVAKELFAAEHERAALADRRRNERERKARSRDVTGQDVTPCDVPADLPAPNKSPPDPQKLTPTPRVCANRAREGWHRLPEGWVPTRPLPAKIQAKVDQWPPGALGDELSAFQRWAANAKNENGKGRKLDWDKAWLNWIERRHDERYARSNTNGMGRNQPANDGLSPTSRAAERVFGVPFGARDERRVPQ